MDHLNIYLDTYFSSFLGSLKWVFKMILCEVSWTQNYFWGLIILSIVVGVLELIFPWRKKQKFLRQDFFLDFFYMFFNFFLFSTLISGGYEVIDIIGKKIGFAGSFFQVGFLAKLPNWGQLLVFFLALDFVQWLTHICLHRFNFLWKYHRVHHSVKEMGFAAHLRYHWMENILYKPAKILIIMLIGGFEPESAYIMHYVAISIGHLNHANIKLSYGPLKYILNNPIMHLHHHAFDLPNGSFGKNFGISLSLWDYVFRTNYIPNENAYTHLGFKGDDEFPKSFIKQSLII